MSITSDTAARIRTSKVKVEYPVSLTEAKRHLRVEDSFVEDDDLIERIIEDATEIIEDEIQKDIAKTENVSDIYNFNGDIFKLNQSPLNEITEVKTDASTLISVKNSFPFYNYFMVELDDSATSDPLTVSYITGYDWTTNLIPKTLKRAILIKIGDLYDVERQGYSPNGIKNNQAVERLTAKYKSTTF